MKIDSEIKTAIESSAVKNEIVRVDVESPRYDLMAIDNDENVSELDFEEAEIGVDIVVSGKYCNKCFTINLVKI